MQTSGQILEKVCKVGWADCFSNRNVDENFLQDAQVNTSFLINISQQFLFYTPLSMAIKNYNDTTGKFHSLFWPCINHPYSSNYFCNMYTLLLMLSLSLHTENRWSPFPHPPLINMKTMSRKALLIHGRLKEVLPSVGIRTVHGKKNPHLKKGHGELLVIAVCYCLLMRLQTLHTVGSKPLKSTSTLFQRHLRLIIHHFLNPTITNSWPNLTPFIQFIKSREIVIKKKHLFQFLVHLFRNEKHYFNNKNPQSSEWLTGHTKSSVFPRSHCAVFGPTEQENCNNAGVILYFTMFQITIFLMPPALQPFCCRKRGGRKTKSKMSIDTSTTKPSRLTNVESSGGLTKAQCRTAAGQMICRK